MNRYIGLICTGILTLLAASDVQAVPVDRFWQSGTGILSGVKYTNTGNTDPLAAPLPTDIVNVGAGGTATLDGSDGPASFGKLRVGHAEATAAALNGRATVTLQNGAQLALTGGASGIGNAAMWVGAGNGSAPNGTLNIDNATLTANRLVVVGYGNNVARTGTLNIANGGNLTVTIGNLTLAERTVSGSSGGVQGFFNMDGASSVLSVNGAGAQLVIGNYTAKGVYDQKNGTATIKDVILVGQRNSDNSSFSISGGTITAGAMNLSTGTTADGNSDNIAANITGTAQVTLGASELFTANAVSPNGLTNTSLLAGSFDAKNTSVVVKDDAILTTSGLISIGVDNALNSSLTVSNNAKFNVGANITIGSNNADGSKFTITDLADVNATGNIFIGRGTSKNAKFIMTGGTLDTGGQFLVGTAISPGATNIVCDHSGGTLTSVSYFTLADTFGESTYNLSGSGVVNSGAEVVVGRRNATGTLNQSGGTLTAALGISIGKAFDLTNTPSYYATGIYNVSGGIINANQTTGTALAIAPQANAGTFRVIGDDADINVNGNMTVNSAAGIVGTLAYRLETGESLSVIDVTGTATFASGAILDFDTSLASPTQTSYDLLIARSIVDSGISFTFPGWGYRIVDVPLAGDDNDDRFVDAADYVTWRSNDDANDQGYVDFRENFSVAGRQLLQVYSLSESSSSLQGLNNTAVPEPAGTVLLLFGAFSLMLTRRR